MMRPAVLLAMLLGACAPAQPPVTMGPEKSLGFGAMQRDPGKDRGEYVEVEVFYATDRSRTGAAAASEFYGTGRGTLEYGIAGVSIPRRHQRGELESPVWWQLEFSEDPERHVVLLSVGPMTRTLFHGAVARRAGADGRRNVLVFVHGFNVSFADAARRTAQIAYDLEFPGVPVVYSWPSQGAPTPLGYTTDETNVEWTEPHLKSFLVELAASLGSEVRIHLVAHSMGNRALTKALRSIAAEAGKPLFSQVVLAAPDIDRDVFERDIAPAVVKTALRTTLYASSQDRALIFSQTVHTYARAGQSIQPLVHAQGLDTVDASGIDTSFLGHSYVAVPLLLRDLLMLVRHNLGPLQRDLRPVPPPPAAQRYWSFGM